MALTSLQKLALQLEQRLQAHNYSDSTRKYLIEQVAPAHSYPHIVRNAIKDEEAPDLFPALFDRHGKPLANLTGVPQEHHNELTKLRRNATAVFIDPTEDSK